MKIGPRSAVEILQEYAEFILEMEELGRKLQSIAADKRRQHELGGVMAEYSGTLQSKQLETWVEIAAQLAEFNQQFKEKKA